VTKREEILENPDVGRWHTNLGRGSATTAEVYLRRLNLFCRQNNYTPGELVELGRGDKKRLQDLLLDHVTWMEDEEYSPGYIAGIVKSVKSWLNFNDVQINRRIRISNRDATPTLQDERIPSKEELKALLRAGDERAGAIICLVAMSGVRLQVIGNAEGDDGLRIGDLPELVVEGDHVSFSRVPTMVEVRTSLSKANHRYYTFLPREACDYLATYLDLRLSRGEKLAEDTPVVATRPGYTDEEGSRFMTTRNVSRIIRDTMRPRFQWRPYVLRSYFDTNLLLAESHGKVTHPYRVFFMGHKGDIEARYTTNKGILPQDLVEDMRRAFQESSQYLETTVRQTQDKKEMLLEMWKQQAKLYGINPTKIKIEQQKKTGEELTPEEEQELLMTEIKKITMPQTKIDNDKPYKSKIVEENELVPCIEEGWEIIKELSSNRYLIKRPNHIEIK
jgi:integrase